MKKNNYWESRIQEQEEKALERNNKQTEKELAKIYKQTANNVRNEILEVYTKIADEAEDEILINDFYRNKRYWELHARLNELLNELGEEQIRITEPAILEMYEKTLELIDEEAPTFLVERKFLHPSVIDGKQALFQSWCLDGKNFSDRVWLDKKNTLLVLKEELNKNLLQGKSPWQTAQNVAERLEVSKANAYRLMRTETAHAQIYGKIERYKEMGITNGKWIADSCSCPHCREHGGEIYPLSELASKIPAHPNCRCSFSAVIE